MARAELLADLKIDEGCRLAAYPDPLSPLAKACQKAGIDFTRNWRKLPGASALSGHPWTVGYGHTGTDVSPATVWTQAQADAVLAKDVDKHCAELIEKAPWVANLDPVRRDVLFNMAFNLGIAGLIGFVNTLAAVKRGDYERACIGMLASKWASQVKSRAQRLAKQMRTGVR